MANLLLNHEGNKSEAALRMPSSEAAARQQAEMQRRIRKEKETFLIFTRVLMKYLETKDPPLYIRVKSIIKDCAERNKRHEPGYESVTTSMKGKIKEVVSKAHWSRAKVYLKRFLQQRKKPAQQSAAQSNWIG
mmetsp:Transcript_13844/g.18069  ORF Transcript_13844/g.18069 Transcript_13844/m.18069 type:complete len:133 (-) Transcript_13844:1899-2297(-)